MAQRQTSTSNKKEEKSERLKQAHSEAENEKVCASNRQQCELECTQRISPLNRTTTPRPPTKLNKTRIYNCDGRGRKLKTQAEK